jgi:hypothetical protein
MKLKCISFLNGITPIATLRERPFNFWGWGPWLFFLWLKFIEKNISKVKAIYILTLQISTRNIGTF